MFLPLPPGPTWVTTKSPRSPPTPPFLEKGEIQAEITGKARNEDNQSNYHKSRHQHPKGKGKGKGLQRPNQKGKGKGNRKKVTANARNSQYHECAYCQKDGHEAQECRKRLYDEKHGTLKKAQTNNSQHFQPLEVEDETALMFRNNATFTYNTTEATLSKPDHEVVNDGDESNDQWHIPKTAHDADNESELTNKPSTLDPLQHAYQADVLQTILHLPPGYLQQTNKANEHQTDLPTSVSAPLNLMAVALLLPAPKEMSS
jgi:hypothetical protein